MQFPFIISIKKNELPSNKPNKVYLNEQNGKF